MKVNSFPVALLTPVSALLFAEPAVSAVTLVESSQPRAVIVRSPSAGTPGALAADELKGGIERITGVSLAIADAPSNGLASVRLALAGPDDAVLPDRVRALAGKIRDDGYALCTDAGSLSVV